MELFSLPDSTNPEVYLLTWILPQITFHFAQAQIQ
jgi:hypothetical protein